MNSVKSIIAGLVLTSLFSLARGDDAPRDQSQPADRGNVPRLLEQFDRNQDNVLEPDEMPARMRQRFPQMDADGDGKLTAEEMQRFARRPGNLPGARNPAQGTVPLFDWLDTDGNGKLDAEELKNAPQRLAELDKNEDGMVERTELATARRPAGRPGEVITPAARAERLPEKLKVGEAAPDFTLPLVAGGGTVTLSSFRDKRPVVLIFASYT